VNTLRASKAFRSAVVKILKMITLVHCSGVVNRKKCEALPAVNFESTLCRSCADITLTTEACDKALTPSLASIRVIGFVSGACKASAAWAMALIGCAQG
jgi:hypothetical protein